MPQCQNDEEIYQNLERIAGGDTQGVTCTSPQIAPFLVNQQDIKGVTQVADALDTKIAVVTQESRITALLGDIYNVSKTIAELKVMVLEFRADVQGIIRWLYVIFGVGCIVCAVGIFYTRAGERIKRSILLLFTTGFAVSFVALLHYLIFSRLLMRAIPFDKMAIGSTVLTPTEVTALTDSIRFIVEYIITGLVSLSFTLGIWVMGGAAVLYGIYMTFVHRCEITTYMRNLRKKSIT